ncbi:MAG: nickel-dependent lactate racemase [Armatimonadetes bacterium]|nr:nickel-dependent lactate racemase [Armatimonadota bacterium]
MRITFPYPDVSPLDVPDKNLLGYIHPKRVDSPAPEEELIRGALRNPISAPRLCDAVRPEHAVLLVVDDLTRPTPIARLLPPILDELHQGGVEDSRIAFLMAYGSHRDMTDEEKRERLGNEIVDRYVVLDHHYDDENQLRDRGRSGEMPVLVNRHVVEADFVIGVGHIVPHRSHGFGGGGKIILPGVAAKACVDRMHWMAAQIPIANLLGRIENPIRRLTDEFALRAGLSYIIDVVQDDEERLVGVWAGDPVKAHRKGCEQSREIYCVSIPEPADICVIDSYPADIDLWQANKALFASEAAVKPEGVADFLWAISMLPEFQLVR